MMPVVGGVIVVEREHEEFCGWCGYPIVDGDQHGIVTVADDGGADVKCRVNLICDMPATCCRIDSIGVKE